MAIIGLLVILGLSSAVSSIRIGAFNIQKFGEAKLLKTITYNHGASTVPVPTVLFEIIKRYDIVLIQEIQMPDNLFKLFVDNMNIYLGLNANVGYGYLISPYLGTGNTDSGKEKYAYIYKKTSVTVNAVVFPDNAGNINFDRSPYIATVHDQTSNPVKSFHLVGLHARPCNCIYEMIKLETVYNWLKANNYMNYDRVILLGDFNAGCTYFKVGVDYLKVPFLFDNLHSSIEQYIHGNTNVLGTCPYDRMAISRCIYSRDALNNANIFKFTTQLILQGKPLVLTLNEAKEVSDHFPIEVEVTGNGVNPPPGCVAP